MVIVKKLGSSFIKSINFSEVFRVYGKGEIRSK